LLELEARRCAEAVVEVIEAGFEKASGQRGVATAGEQGFEDDAVTLTQRQLLGSMSQPEI